MNIEDALNELKKAKFKNTKPESKNALPQFMKEWDEKRIDDYYKDREPLKNALEVAVAVLKNVNSIEKACNGIKEVIDSMDKD